jgi:hypothetical protein
MWFIHQKEKHFITQGFRISAYYLVWHTGVYRCIHNVLTLLVTDSAVSSLELAGDISIHVSFVITGSLLPSPWMLGGQGPASACSTSLATSLWTSSREFWIRVIPRISVRNPDVLILYVLLNFFHHFIHHWQIPGGHSLCPWLESSMKSPKAFSIGGDHSALSRKVYKKNCCAMIKILTLIFHKSYWIWHWNILTLSVNKPTLIVCPTQRWRTSEDECKWFVAIWFILLKQSKTRQWDIEYGVMEHFFLLHIFIHFGLRNTFIQSFVLTFLLPFTRHSFSRQICPTASK